MCAAVALQTEELLESFTSSQHLISCLSDHPPLFDLCITLLSPTGGAIAASYKQKLGFCLKAVASTLAERCEVCVKL